MCPKESQEFAKQVLINPFQLVDLHKIEDTDTKAHVWSKLMELSMRATILEYRNNMELRGKKLSKKFKLIENEPNALQYIDSILCYTIFVGDTSSQCPRKYIEIITDELSESNKEGVMTLADKFEEKGIEKVALELITQNAAFELISKVTNISISKLKQLKADNQDKFNEEKNLRVVK